MKTQRAHSRLYLAAIALGAVSVLGSGFGIAVLVRAISLQEQGKCDFLPCADAGSYRIVQLLAVIGVAGAALLVITALRLLSASRRGSS